MRGDDPSMTDDEVVGSILECVGEVALDQIAKQFEQKTETLRLWFVDAFDYLQRFGFEHVTVPADASAIDLIRLVVENPMNAHRGTHDVLRLLDAIDAIHRGDEPDAG